VLFSRLHGFSLLTANGQQLTRIQCVSLRFLFACVRG
jgi:hypothetical protein